MATKAELGVMVWPILTDAAARRGVLTYEEVATALGRQYGQWVRHALDPVQDYCLKNKLPPLTILVVNKATRRPGEGFIAWTGPLEDGQEEAWRFDWTSVRTPTVEEFDAAWREMADFDAPEGEEVERLGPIPDLGPVDVFDRIEGLLTRRRSFETMKLRRPFTASTREMDLEFRINSGEIRRVPYREFVAVLRRWKATPEPTIGTFQDITRNASYLCVVIQEALKPAPGRS